MSQYRLRDTFQGQMLQTPKKIYPASSNATSCCRLCKAVRDSDHCRNLFGKANRTLLVVAENIYGSSFQRSESLPHLLCRPCERRLRNFIAFKALISESQRSLERAKRCMEESPSAHRSLKTSKATETSRVSRGTRRGLHFPEPNPLESGSQVSRVWQILS